MDFSGSHFIYSGVSSRKYGLVFANADTDRVLSLSGEIKTETVYNRNSQKNYMIGESFIDSPLTFEAEIVLDVDRCLDTRSKREVEKWLFHQADYRKLYIDPDDDCYGETYELINGIQKQLYLNCRFVNPRKIEGNGGVFGYMFTVECDSCMAWQDAVVHEFDVEHEDEDSNSIISVCVDSDLNEYIYPKVTIRVGDIGGRITISNNSDEPSRLTSFIDVPPYMEIVMNGNGINYISGDNYLRFSDKNFIRLLDGENKLALIGNVDKLIIEFQNRRYL